MVITHYDCLLLPDIISFFRNYLKKSHSSLNRDQKLLPAVPRKLKHIVCTFTYIFNADVRQKLLIHFCNIAGEFITIQEQFSPATVSLNPNTIITTPARRYL